MKGATAVLRSNGAKQDPLLAGRLERKERLVAAVALADKMARIGWAVMRRQTNFRAASAAA